MDSHTDRDIALRLRWEAEGLDDMEGIGKSICEMMNLNPEAVIIIKLANGNHVEGRWNGDIPGAERIYVKADRSVAGRSKLFTGDQWDRRIAEEFALMQEEGRI